MRGESMKGKSKKSTYSTTFGVDPVFIIYTYLFNINKAAYYLESSAGGELQLFYRSLPLRSCNVLETLFKCIFLL